MSTVTKKRIKEIGKLLGVNLTIDKTLVKYAKVVPEKVEESNKLLANSTFEL